MGDLVKVNKFHLFSSTVANLLYENAYFEINRLYSGLTWQYDTKYFWFKLE